MNRITVFYDHVRNAMRQEGMTFDEIAGLLRDAGISGTEIEYCEIKGLKGRALARKLERAGLKVSSVYCFFRWEQDRPNEDYIKVLKCLQKNRIHNLLVIPGFKLEGESSKESAGKLVGYVRKLCEEAPKYGVKVVMEDFDDKVASFASAEELKWYMDSVPELGCAFDTGNFLYCEEDALDVLPMFIDRIAYVHCKDRSFTPVDGEDFKETIGGRGMYSSAVGAGVIKMQEIVERILATGYEGPFAIEHFGSLKQLSDMIESAGFLKGLMERRDAKE